MLSSGGVPLGGSFGPLLDFAVARRSSQNAPLAYLFTLHKSKRRAHRGFVLRGCTRKADEAWARAALGHGLADTRFCRKRTGQRPDGVRPLSPEHDVSVAALSP